MKKLILILLLVPTLGFNQRGNFMFNQHSSNTACIYGNLANYTVDIFGFTCFYFDDCVDYAQTSSLADVRAVYDNVRAGCTFTTGATGYACYTDTLKVGKYTLQSSFGSATCLLAYNSASNWVMANSPFSPVGTGLIVEIQFGIITYIEYY